MQVPAPFEYERATSVDHAIGLLDRLGDSARLVAGGHSLLPMMKLRLAAPEHVIDIDGLATRLDRLAGRAVVSTRSRNRRGHGIRSRPQRNAGRAHLYALEIPTSPHGSTRALSG